MYYTFNLNENVIKQNCFKENKKQQQKKEKQQQPNKSNLLEIIIQKKGQVNLC